MGDTRQSEMTVPCHFDAGSELVVVENERVPITFWPRRGNDIVELQWRPLDLDFFWRDPQVEGGANPLAMPHAGGSEFYDTSHGGWLLSLLAGSYPRDYFGDRLGTLGEFCQLEWRITWTRAGAGGPVTVCFEASGARTPFHVMRKVTLDDNSDAFTLHTRITNLGGQALPLACIEHALSGAKFFKGAALFSVASQILIVEDGRGEHAQLRAGTTNWPHAVEPGGALHDSRKPPVKGSEAEHLVVLDGWKETRAGLQNAELRLGLQLEWDSSPLPRAWVWATGEGGNLYPVGGRAHVVDIKPANVVPIPFAREFVSKILPLLDSGTSFEMGLFGRFITSAPTA